MFGLAVKALHDFSILTDNTWLKDREQDKAVRLFEEVGLSGANNRIRLSLQPLPHNEAVSFWTAASSPLRLSAHYQASVILLEPEEPPSRAGRVLTYGVYPFVSGAPRLTGSENTLRFKIPGTSTIQEIRLRPAEVPVGSLVMFTGIALTGDETHLLLKNPHWRAPRQADASWSINATVDRITATVQATIDGEPIQPGIYAAAARVVRFQPTPEGQKRRFEHTSNDTPFTITPRIDGVGEDSNGVRAITGHILYLPARQDGDEPDAYSTRVAGIIERSDIRVRIPLKSATHSSGRLPPSPG